MRFNGFLLGDTLSPRKRQKCLNNGCTQQFAQSDNLPNTETVYQRMENKLSCHEEQKIAPLTETCTIKRLYCISAF